MLYPILLFHMKKLKDQSPRPDQPFPARHLNTISVNCDLTLGRGGFLYPAARVWNLLSPELRGETKPEIFKTDVKKWIRENHL